MQTREPVRSSQAAATSGGIGAPATAVTRALARSASARWGLSRRRMTLVGTPTSIVARCSVASLNTVSGVNRGSCSMISAAPRRRQKRHIPPMPWVSGDMTRTRSASVTSSRPVNPAKVACFSPALSEASFGIPVVPLVSAISTIRSGGEQAGWGRGRFAQPARRARGSEGCEQVRQVGLGDEPGGSRPLHRPALLGVAERQRQGHDHPTRGGDRQLQGDILPAVREVDADRLPLGQAVGSQTARSGRGRIRPDPRRTPPGRHRKPPGRPGAAPRWRPGS